MQLPRLALGAIQPRVETRWASWALMELLTRSGRSVQHFHARCCFQLIDGATTITGQGSRHLDSWVMQSDVCRASFLRGAADGNLACVEGPFDAAREVSGGGSLDTLCQWLDLPRFVVLDVRALDSAPLVDRPQADALLLDNIVDERDYARRQSQLESLWNIPVLGGLAAVPALRKKIESLTCGSLLPRPLCDALGDAAMPFVQLDEIAARAARRAPLKADDSVYAARKPNGERSPLRIAVAYDEAFHGYFCDVLELLGAIDARVVEFSPLHDEQLPADADIVYIGCGRPDLFAAELSENCCMHAALRRHVRERKRLFADGGGLAYACESVDDPDGRRWGMAGLAPALAHRIPTPGDPLPAEITLARPCWLGKTGAHVRGYLNPRWRLEPRGAVTSLAAESEHAHTLIGSQQAIVSRLHLNFAAHPALLENMTQPAVAVG